MTNVLLCFVFSEVFEEISRLPPLDEETMAEGFTKKAACDLELLSRRGQSEDMGKKCKLICCSC